MVNRAMLWVLYRRLQRQNRQSRRRRIERFRQQQRKSLLLLLLMGFLVCRYYVCTERMIWSKDRSSEWWDRVVSHFTREEWKENFRMDPSTFRYLCNEVSTTLNRRSTVMRDAISVERRVAMTLWRLATNSDYRTTGHLFGVAKVPSSTQISR